MTRWTVVVCTNMSEEITVPCISCHSVSFDSSHCMFREWNDMDTIYSEWGGIDQTLVSICKGSRHVLSISYYVRCIKCVSSCYRWDWRSALRQSLAFLANWKAYQEVKRRGSRLHQKFDSFTLIITWNVDLMFSRRFWLIHPSCLLMSQLPVWIHSWLRLWWRSCKTWRSLGELFCVQSTSHHQKYLSCLEGTSRSTKSFSHELL